MSFAYLVLCPDSVLDHLGANNHDVMQIELPCCWLYALGGVKLYQDEYSIPQAIRFRDFRPKNVAWRPAAGPICNWLGTAHGKWLLIIGRAVSVSLLCLQSQAQNNASWEFDLALGTSGMWCRFLPSACILAPWRCFLYSGLLLGLFLARTGSSGLISSRIFIGASAMNRPDLRLNGSTHPDCGVDVVFWACPVRPNLRSLLLAGKDFTWLELFCWQGDALAGASSISLHIPLPKRIFRCAGHALTGCFAKNAAACASLFDPFSAVASIFPEVVTPSLPLLWHTFSASTSLSLSKSITEEASWIDGLWSSNFGAPYALCSGPTFWWPLFNWAASSEVSTVLNWSSVLSSGRSGLVTSVSILSLPLSCSASPWGSLSLFCAVGWGDSSRKLLRCTGSLSWRSESDSVAVFVSEDDGWFLDCLAKRFCSSRWMSMGFELVPASILTLSTNLFIQFTWAAWSVQAFILVRSKYEDFM